MSSTTDTPDCLSCDEPMTPCTLSNRTTPAAEDHDGFRCPECSQVLIDCPYCSRYHYPDTICEPERDARSERATERFGSSAEIPGHGTVPVSDLEIVGEATPIYVVEDACPIDGCNGDLVYTLERNAEYGNPDIPEAEFQPAAANCTNADGLHPACTYSKP